MLLFFLRYRWKCFLFTTGPKESFQYKNSKMQTFTNKKKNKTKNPGIFLNSFFPLFLMCTQSKHVYTCYFLQSSFLSHTCIHVYAHLHTHKYVHTHTHISTSLTAEINIQVEKIVPFTAMVWKSLIHWHSYFEFVYFGNSCPFTLIACVAPVPLLFLWRTEVLKTGWRNKYHMLTWQWRGEHCLKK